MHILKILITLMLQASAKRNYIVLFKHSKTEDREVAKMELSSKIVKSQSHFREGDTIIKGLSNGYLSVLSEETAKKLQEDPSVEIVEEDKSVGILKQEIFDFGFRDIIGKSSMHLMIQHDAPWGLSFLSGENTSKGDYVFPENAGEGVDVYVIDSGVMVDHPDFEGRARFGANLVEGSPDMDENGHGTHCAGTIGGSKYGVAKRANIVAVKVLDGYGQGMISRVIQGIDFVIKEHEEKTDMMYKMSMQKYFDHKMRENYLLGFAGKRSTSIRNLNDVVNDFVSQSMYPETVINMSVGGEKSRALDFAIDYAVSLGIHISVAAGNEKESACLHSPGSAMYAVTSGAFKEDNKMAEFSNYGKCVDIYAPGVNILSAWNDGSYRIASGTSMAAPHTSGVMALYLSYKDFTPKDLKKTIIDDATCTVADQKTSSYIWLFNLIFNTNNLPALSTHNLIKKYKKSQN